MIRKEERGVIWLEFASLQGYPLRHGIFCKNREGQGFLSGEDPKVAEKNLFNAAALLRADHVVSLQQKHGKEIFHVTSAVTQQQQGDALLSQLPRVALHTKHADCQSALFYDRKKHAIANVHCGWRGSVANIYGHVISTMQRLYNTHPEDLLVCIGPSLSPESMQFLGYRQLLPPSLWKYETKMAYFDFWALSRDQLLASGVPEKQIEFAEIDTLTAEELCFSHRRGDRGRMGTLCVLE